MARDLDEPEVIPSPATDDLDDPSRRVFVHRLTFMGGGVVLLGSACKACNEPAKVDAGVAAAPKQQALTTSHLTFTNDDFAIVAAAAERVLPKDEDAGALDANVPEYIDRILQTPQLDTMKKNFVPGVAALDRRCERMFKVGFAKATPQQQDEVLTIFKNSPESSGEAHWYDTLVVLSLEGYLGDPSYGGNRDQVGWKTIGFTMVDHTNADPGKGYDGSKALQQLRCGGGKGC
ncbi:MAG: gluconate 2-dehydrogenase subunit 3 family protein [Archangiaceae bacterium]|nr:gluconate 2-dehydrogenase subunit 3 family protein [Archangiaceae bacterium]